MSFPTYNANFLKNKKNQKKSKKIKKVLEKIKYF